MNPFDLIRKYRCAACKAIMMCACDEDIGSGFFPHQWRWASILETQERIPVTHGFLPRICNPCRGLKEQAYPRGQRHRRTSKIRRYYWREIALATMRGFGAWAREQGMTWQEARTRYPEKQAEIQQRVIDEIKREHLVTPKYKYHDESYDEIIKANRVEVITLSASYAPQGKGRVRVIEGTDTLSVEEYAERHFQRHGYKTLRLESRPIHALFGVYFWLLVQDPTDPRVRMVGIGARPGQESDRGILWFPLPEDFGTTGYPQRRAQAIREHFALLPDDRKELLWLLDYWTDPSESLRQYLHVWEPDHIQRARELVRILPPRIITEILGYLVDGYWRRFCGWPDLLVYTPYEFFFAEVKSSKDKLSEDQKAWIRGNHQHLGLPFKLVKILRACGSGDVSSVMKSITARPMLGG